jgi:5-hydroxyisourate hydrolase
MSIHVVDVSRGVIAAGLPICVERLCDGTRALVCRGMIGADGGLAELGKVSYECISGVYEVTFRVGDYYRSQKSALPDIPFLDVVPYRFGLADPLQHYHLPFKMTPWGFSCFRGGA